MNMLKKIITTALYLAFIAALVFGGIIRTQAVTGSSDNGENETTDLSNSGIVETTNSDWVTLEGTIQSWEDSTLTVLTDTGALILIEGRGGRFLEENSFFANPGDRVTMTGYYEGDVFEVATITNQATGVSIRLRGDDGRPVWGSGGGGQ
jgi:hypothetical protein